MNGFIKSITISNFKCFKEETINFGDLTLIAGLNNVGKSTIYQILLLLKQSYYKNFFLQYIQKNGPVLDLNGEIIQLGNAEELFNNFKDDKISISINFFDESKLCFSYKLLRITMEDSHSILILDTVKIETTDKDKMIISLDFERRNEHYYIKATNCLQFENYNLMLMIEKYIKQNFKEFDENKDIYLLQTVEFEQIKKISTMLSLIEKIEIDIKYIRNCIAEKYRFLFEDTNFKLFLEKEGYFENKDVRNQTFSLISSYSKIKRMFVYFIEELMVINPFRGEPKRVYIETEYKNPLLVTTKNFEKTLIYKHYEDETKVKKGTLTEALKYWLSKILDNISSFNINVLVEGLVSETFITEGEKDIAITNVGFGISQVLPLILKVLMHDFCIIDEPEVHLHPALQSKMADFFIEMIKLNKQLIIETHSDHIINRIIYHKLLKENKNKQINMLWVEKDQNSNNSTIREIEYDELGYMKNQPEGFLDETEKNVEKINKIRMENL